MKTAAFFLFVIVLSISTQAKKNPDSLWGIWNNDSNFKLIKNDPNIQVGSGENIKTKDLGDIEIWVGIKHRTRIY